MSTYKYNFKKNNLEQLAKSATGDVTKFKKKFCSLCVEKCGVDPKASPLCVPTKQLSTRKFDSRVYSYVSILREAGVKIDGDSSKSMCNQVC